MDLAEEARRVSPNSTPLSAPGLLGLIIVARSPVGLTSSTDGTLALSRPEFVQCTRLPRQVSDKPTFEKVAIEASQRVRKRYAVSEG